MKVLRIAAVADAAQAIGQALIEAIPPTAHRRVVGELPGVHLGHGFWLQDARPIILPILEMGQHEVRHIPGSGAQRPGRRGLDVLKILRLEDAVDVFVALRRIGGQALWHWLVEGAVRHLQRLEDVFFDVLLIGHA